MRNLHKFKMATAKPVIYTICYIFVVNTYFLVQWSTILWFPRVANSFNSLFSDWNSFHSQIPPWQINLYLRCHKTSIICNKLYSISKHVLKWRLSNHSLSLANYFPGSPALPLNKPITFFQQYIYSVYLIDFCGKLITVEFTLIWNIWK